MTADKSDFLHLLTGEVEEFYKIKIPEYTGETQRVFTISNYLSGMYKKKIYINFLSGHMIDYKISYFIFNMKIF